MNRKNFKQKKAWLILLGILLAGFSVMTCEQVDNDPPEGLAKAPSGNGPVITWDLDARPFPEIPFPNDAGTRVDKSSPTGKRLNFSQIADTWLETDLRMKVDTLTGFGIFGNASISFEDLIDINIIIERHQKNNIFEDDAVFLFNIQPGSKNYGKPVLLDLGRGNFPLQTERNDNYFPNDPRVYGSNLFLETYEEDANGNGEFDIGEDTDFDGVFDHPNVFVNGAWVNEAPASLPGNPRNIIDDVLPYWTNLVDFYERETNTLIMRPVLPLEEESVYAVVITNRLKGLPDKDNIAWPVRSPFEYINHTAQTEELERLKGILPRYGLTMDDVAFAWKFTTGSQTRDMVAIRKGLYGYGTMGYLANRFPAEMDMYEFDIDIPEVMLPNPYFIKAADLIGALGALTGLIDLEDALGVSAEDVQQLFASYDYVDYFFFASFDSPDFLVDRDGIATPRYPADDDEIFEMNPLTGQAVLGDGLVTIMCTVPKPNHRLEDVRSSAAVPADIHARSKHIQTHVDHRLGVVHVNSDTGSLDGNSLSISADTGARVYDFKFSSDLGDFQMGYRVGSTTYSAGTGNISADFTTSEGWLTIPAVAWGGTFFKNEIGRIEIEPYIDEVTGPFTQTYTLTFTTVSDFNVTDEQGSPVVLCNTGADCDGFNGWLTIGSQFWSDPSAWVPGAGAVIEIETAGMGPPYPTVIEGHGYTSMKFEILGFAGNLGKHGIAVCGVDSVGHGVGLGSDITEFIDPLCPPDPSSPAYPLLVQLCPLVDAVFELLVGRARDLNNDGIEDSGGDFWSADTFHTRDIVRQTIIDQMQLVRIIRNFNGTNTWEYDINQNGLPDDLAGDVNGDGEVDFGGWTNDFYTWGISLGGILSGFLAGIEPAITAAAPVSGGAGLIDIAARSTQGGVVEAVFLRLFGPIVIGDAAGKLTFWIPDVNNKGRVDIGVTNQIEEGDKVVLRNLRSGEENHAIAGPNGTFRVHIAADAVNTVEKRVILDWPVDYVPGDTCRPLCDVPDSLALGDPLEIVIHDGRFGPVKHVIDTWLQDVRWQGSWFLNGTPLVAPFEGLGHYRGTPDFRKFIGIAQSIMDPADPGTYSVRYHMPADPATAPNSFYTPLGPLDFSDMDPDIVMGANVLVIPTIGDTNVPQNTAISQARVANMIELFEDDPNYGMTQNQVLIANHVVEGVEKITDYYPLGGGMGNYHILFDIDDLSHKLDCPQPISAYNLCTNNPDPIPSDYICTLDGTTSTAAGNVCGDGYNAPTLDPPLRITVQTETGVAGMRIPYMQPTGQHGYDVAKPTRAFDIDQYNINMIGRYFQSNGTDLSDDPCQAGFNDCLYHPPPPQ
jgi:hypothetical protein